MIDRGFGHFVNISSIWGKGAPSNRSAYASAKFAIIGLMDCIRHEVRMVLLPNAKLSSTGESILHLFSCGVAHAQKVHSRHSQ